MDYVVTSYKLGQDKPDTDRCPDVETVVGKAFERLLDGRHVRLGESAIAAIGEGWSQLEIVARAVLTVASASTEPAESRAPASVPNLAPPAMFADVADWTG